MNQKIWNDLYGPGSLFYQWNQDDYWQNVMDEYWDNQNPQ